MFRQLWRRVWTATRFDAMDEPAQKQFVADNMDSDLQFVLADSGVGAGTSSGDRTPLWELEEVPRLR